MDHKSLIAWRKNPNLIGKNEVQELESLLQEFPYFSLGQILLAKGYKNLNHYKLAEQVKKATLYCQDREWFYHFIHSENSPTKKVQVKPKVEEKSKKVEVKKEVKPLVVEIPKKEGPVSKVVSTAKPVEKRFVLKKDSAWKAKGIKETDKEEKEETKPIAALKEPVIKKEVEVKAEPKRRGRPPKVKEESIKAAPKRRGRPPKVKVEAEVKAAPKRRGRPPKVKEEEITVTPKRRGRPPIAKEAVKPKRKGLPPRAERITKPKKDELTAIDNAEKVIAKEKVETKPVLKEKKKTASKKVEKKKKKSKKKKKAKVVLDEKALLDELMLSNIQYNLEDHYALEVENVQEETKESSEPNDFFAWLKSTDKEEIKEEKELAQEPNNKGIETKPHKSLVTIEKFLSNKTTSKKKKASFFSPAEMAKRSDNIEGEIVSETLAKLYEEQERYPEAILTYEKLILLFPQKETYFATRIKNLRNLDKK